MIKISKALKRSESKTKNQKQEKCSTNPKQNKENKTKPKNSTNYKENKTVQSCYGNSEDKEEKCTQKINSTKKTQKSNENNQKQNDNNGDGQRLIENLSKFCDYLDTVIQNAYKVLNKGYSDKHSKELRDKLQKQVKELLIIQKEIQTIVDNIHSLRLQIQAIQQNTKDHKKKLKNVKNKEKRTKFLLENRQNDKKIKEAPLTSIIAASKPNDHTGVLLLNDTKSITTLNLSQSTILPHRRPPPPPPLSAPIFRKLKPRIRRKREKVDNDENGVKLYLKPIEKTNSTTTISTDWAWPD